MVVARSSEIYVGTALGVARAPSPRRRLLEERASQLLNKLVDVLWQPVRDQDSSAIPAVISAEPIAGGDDVPGRADAAPSAARRSYLRKKVELEQYGYTRGCPGCHVARLDAAVKPDATACPCRVEEAVTGEEIAALGWAETLWRRDGRREPEDPEVEVPGVAASRPALRPRVHTRRQRTDFFLLADRPGATGGTGRGFVCFVPISGDLMTALAQTEADVAEIFGPGRFTVRGPPHSLGSPHWL